MFDLVQVLQQLVAIPSVNPMQLTEWRDEHGEARLTDYLEGLFRRLGVPYLRQPVEPHRDNILAKVEGVPAPSQGGKIVLFEVHQDTVSVDGMTIPPWTPTIRDGRLFGRGACDVKGGMAAMLGALADLALADPAPADAATLAPLANIASRTDSAESVPPGRPTLVVACTVNEECAFTGVQALVRLCRDDPSGFIPRMPDVAVVAEPTLLQVVVAHKGAVRWRCHTLGRAAHSATPERGQNAIYRMAAVLAAIERYANEVLAVRAAHPRCGRATVSVGVIHGGAGVNTVPDRCTIEIDRRLIPGEDPAEAQRDLIDYVAAQTGFADQVVHDPPFMHGRALGDSHNAQVAGQLADAARAVAGACECIGVPYATDASSLADAGIPTVVFGPGSIAQAHTGDEWIALDQVEAARRIYGEFIRRGLET